MFQFDPSLPSITSHLSATHSSFFFFLLKGKVRDRERKKTDLSSIGSLPKWLQQLGLGQAEVRGQELFLDLPCG